MSSAVNVFVHAMLFTSTHKKCLVQKVGHLGLLGPIPMIQPPFCSSCVALQYEPGGLDHWLNGCIQWNLHNTDTIGTLPNYPYYRGVLILEVGHSLESHTHQLARLTFITEITQTTDYCSKRRPKGGLAGGYISISGILVS